MLWAQHNDNRMLVPNLVFLGLGVATRDDTTVLVWLSAAVFIAAFALFLILFRSYARLTPIAALMLGFVWFSLIDWQMLLGFSVRLVFHPAVPPRHALLPAARMVRGGSRPGSRRLPVVVPGPRALGGRRRSAGMARGGQADSRRLGIGVVTTVSLPFAVGYAYNPRATPGGTPSPSPSSCWWSSARSFPGRGRSGCMNLAGIAVLAVAVYVIVQSISSLLGVPARGAHLLRTLVRRIRRSPASRGVRASRSRRAGRRGSAIPLHDARPLPL